MKVTLQQDAQQEQASPVSDSATRWDALCALGAFLPKAAAYARGRNFDRPGQQAVSELSPYIRTRLITEREVIEQVVQAHGYSAAEKYIQEVAWRTYWKGYLEQRPGIWARYQKELQQHKESLSGELGRRFEAARSGSTGIDCFDVWSQQLVETGWLHNHARMWFASVWIFTLKLPWQLGAAFFMEHLLDGDPASNTLSWRWVGGLHTRGKHYLARAANISRYTGGRFNPVGQLDESAGPLPADGSFESVPLPAVDSLKDADLPSLSFCPAGLLVTPDDLTPESGELAETPFTSISVFSANDILDTFKASPTVRNFLSEAVLDTCERLAGHWDGRITECHREVIPSVGKASPSNVGRRERMRVYGGTVDNWVQSVLTWAKNENLKSVWMLRPPTGPWADALPGLITALRDRNIRLFQYRRRWDSLHWPHATSGYFRFKKSLRERIEASRG
jgi:deoxyribodipyrimidine photo-lyase